MLYIEHNDNGTVPSHKRLKIPFLKDTIVYCIFSSCLPLSISLYLTLSPTLTHWRLDLSFQALKLL